MKRYGITVTEDGSFVCAKIAFDKKKRWYVEKFFKWDSHSFLRNYFLLHRGVILGLPAHWVRIPPSDLREIKVLEDGNVFKLCFKEPEFTHFTKLIENNLVGICPDDAFLATIPLCFGESIPSSFISIFDDRKRVKIGVVIEEKLYYVLNVKVNSYKEIEGYIALIERYFQKQLPKLSFPQVKYIIGNLPFEVTSQQRINYINIPIEDISELKAIGCALCGVSGKVPSLDNKLRKSSYRLMRATLFYGCTSIIVLALLCTLLVIGLNIKLDKELNKVKYSYNNLISENKEIKKMIDTGDSLSNIIIKLNNMISKPAKWGKFLHFIGKERLKEIYYERLGSEIISGTNSVRVAIAGWSENEKAVRDFVKKLNDSKIVSK
ncbi:MAG: hypothetical protein N2053_07930, partial [Chitinispirillaceae bacterium]|nr:hypothetical protein [Chitinispirillaceae bacterium]